MKNDTLNNYKCKWNIIIFECEGFGFGFDGWKIII